MTMPSGPTAPAPAVHIDPGLWHEPGGLRLFVPEGWSGVAGPSSGSLLASFTHETTGATVEIWAFARSGPPRARPRPGCTWAFEDDASHRVVPILFPAATGTCLSDDPFGPLVQGWYGLVGDREIHVEVVYPHGRVVESREVVEPLLADLTWR